MHHIIPLLSLIVPLITFILLIGKPEQMFASKKSAASYLTNDVPFLAQVKSTKRVVETTDDNEEVKMPASDVNFDLQSQKLRLFYSIDSSKKSRA